MPYADLFAVVGRKVAAAGSDEIEFDEVDLPTGKLAKDREDVRACSGLGEVDLVGALVGTAGKSGDGDVFDMCGSAFDERVGVVQLGVDAGIHVDAEHEALGVEILTETVHAGGNLMRLVFGMPCSS